MLSSALEVAGFSALAAAAFVGAGLVAGLVVVGAELLLIGYAVDDATAAASVRRAVVPFGARLSAGRARVKARRLDRLATKA